MYFYVVACFTCIIISSLLGRRVRSIPSIKHIHHHHKHQGLNPLIRSVSTVTAARANASLIFQLFSFLVVCSGMISKGFGFVAYFASVKASSVCIDLNTDSPRVKWGVLRNCPSPSGCSLAVSCYNERKSDSSSSHSSLVFCFRTAVIRLHLPVTFLQEREKR